MEIFSEIYSCYYRVMRHLLSCQNPLTMQEICNRICAEGFEESLISIIPKLESGAWNLFEKNNNLYLSKLNSHFLTPLTKLEKSYLKALLSDKRIRLFLSQQQLQELDEALALVEPLWQQEQIYYFDQFTDGDPYESKTYCERFRALLHAQKNRQLVDIDYKSPKGNRVHHLYMPARLEYSVKNDKFRLLALEPRKHNKIKLETLNLDRIQTVKLTEKTITSPFNLNELIQKSYYKDPLKLHIINKRNALERAMLHFANYEKNTAQIDKNVYECMIYYNKSMETELLIEVMSFGPMLTVIGNEKFLHSLKARLKKQLALSSSSNETYLC